MECIKCKQAIEDDSVYCRFCGKKQTAERKHKKRANNTGSIYKLPGNRKNPWQAKKNGIYIGTFPTRTEAQKALERITDQQVNDKYNMTFKEVYERWAEVRSREVSEKMMANYKLAFKQCSQLHDKKIRSLLRSDYQQAIIELEKQGKSKSSCDKLRVFLGQIGRWAMVDEGITLTNPAQELTTTAKQKSVRNIFSEEEIRRIKTCNHPAADIALILISCGCRPGELFKVPLVNCRKDHFIGGSKTEAGKNRVIPIGPDGIDAYTRLREKAVSEKAAFLIDAYSGNRTADNFADRDWKELMAEAGIEGVTPYTCRHTFITRAIRSGVDLPTLEAIVGHVDRETTRIYTHLQAQDLVNAVQNVKTDTSAVVNKLSTDKNPSEKPVRKSS